MTMITCLFDKCEKSVFARNYCSGHYQQYLKGKELRPLRRRSVNSNISFSDWYIGSRGYVMRHITGSSATRIEYQHRIVMEQFLNRKLYQNENVHHINGDKTDNRIENLELWDKGQPAGQRVIDKISYCISFLEKQGYQISKK